MSFVFDDRSRTTLWLEATAQRVADRFNPWVDKAMSFFAPSQKTEKVKIDPIIKAYTDNAPLKGVYAALQSDIMNGSLLPHYKRHGDDYPSIDERLEDDLKATLTEYFDRNPVESAKAGAYTRIKAKLFKSPAYRQMINDRGNIKIVADRSLDSSVAEIPVLTDVIREGNPDFYKANNNFNLGAAKEAVSSFLDKANKAVTWGNIISVSSGIAVGATLKVAFNSVAVASGVGLVAAVGYGVAKTTYDEYTNNNQTLGGAFAKATGLTAFKEAAKEYKTEISIDGTTTGQALKSVLSKMTGYGAAKKAFTTKRDEGHGIASSTFAFLKKINVNSTLKNSAIFGIGAAVGYGAIPDAGEVAVAPAVDTVAESPVETAVVAEGNQLTAEEMAIPSAFDEVATVETTVTDDNVTDTATTDTVVEELVIPTPMEQLAELKEQNPALVEKALDGDRNAIKEVAYGLLNDKLGFEQNQALGAQLMKQAADMGHLGAMRDVAWLEANTDFLDVVPVETELASLEVTGQAKELLDGALNGNAQAMNDTAIGLLNEQFGFPKDFDLGVEMLGNAVELGHEKSLADMATLLDYNMVTVDMLSSDAQIQLLDHGTLQASDLTEKAQIQLAERISGEMQEKIVAGADGVCSKTLDTCTFAEGLAEEKKGFIKSAFDAVKTQAKTVVDLVTFNQGTKATIVASIK